MTMTMTMAYRCRKSVTVFGRNCRAFAIRFKCALLSCNFNYEEQQQNQPQPQSESDSGSGFLALCLKSEVWSLESVVWSLSVGVSVAVAVPGVWVQIFNALDLNPLVQTLLIFICFVSWFANMTSDAAAVASWSVAPLPSCQVAQLSGKPIRLAGAAKICTFDLGAHKTFNFARMRQK